MIDNKQMKKLILILATLTSFQAFGDVKVYTKSETNYRLIDIGGVWVSEICKMQPLCLALKVPKLVNKVGHAGNPFADFCKQSEGKFITVTDNLGLREGLCVFKDNSYIVAKDYFVKFKLKK